MRLWKPETCLMDCDLNSDDEYTICEQFLKKSAALTNNTIYKPDLSKDAVLTKNYKLESFDFYEFCNREQCVGSLKCSRLRIQNHELLAYVREETVFVEELLKRYHCEDTDQKTKQVLKELLRKKVVNLKLVEQVRGRIVEIFQKLQLAGDHLDNMYNLIIKDK
ncbi:hypothetical protein GINT2_001336 [Glugoides intestinalis]